MKKIISTQAKLLTLALLFLLNFNLFSKEVFKTKAPGGGANKFKQYSMSRTNDNTGFIYTGTTKSPNGDDCIHVIKTDNQFNTIWSFYYIEVQLHTLNSTKIVKNFGGNGYWVSGYWGDGATHYPYLMQIDENGNMLMHKMVQSEGVFLDIQPTSDNGCIAVGFVSLNIMEIVPVGGRRALITKFSPLMAVNWSTVYHCLLHANGDNFFYELAENVTVINNINTGFQDFYFISGSVSDIDPGKYGSGIDGSLPNLYYTYINNAGGLIYKNTSLEYGSSFDMTYDEVDHKIYFVGKFDVFLDQASIVGKIDVATGTINYQKSMEGLFTGYLYPHATWAYKIEVVDDKLLIFGYLRSCIFSNNPTVSSDDMMIPFHAELNKSDASEISFTLNHTNQSPTNGYPSEDPGFLHAWDNMPSIFSDNFPSVYAPEMGLKYLDANNQTQWAMIGYFDQTGVPITYDLHFINSENNGECNPMERDLDFKNMPVKQIETLYAIFPVTTFEMHIQRFVLDFDSNNCN